MVKKTIGGPYACESKLDTCFNHQQAPFLAPFREASQFAMFNLVLNLLITNTNPYFVAKNSFFCFSFYFSVPRWICSPHHGRRRDVAKGSSIEDIEMQKSDLTLATTHYKVNPRIIKVVATNPFRGLEDDNPYRHIKEFSMICNTVQQGVLTAWFKWNLFQFSLGNEARRWYTLASVEAKGNWDELVKKFLLKFFPISKVEDLRRQVLNFKQGEDEGIEEA
jgi:hypothetical protein